jgi:alkaline phosphatase D
MKPRLLGNTTDTMISFTRRLAMQLMTFGASLIGCRCGRRCGCGLAAEPNTPAQPPGGHNLVTRFRSPWQTSHDRVWLGEQFWANPMEDWRIVDGAAECLTGAGDRNIHLLTHQVTNPDGGFEMSVNIETLPDAGPNGSAEFCVGIRSDLNEYRSNSFSQGGINAGVKGGELSVGRKVRQLNNGDTADRLMLSGKPNGGRYSLTLRSVDANGKTLTEWVRSRFAEGFSVTGGAIDRLDGFAL